MGDSCQHTTIALTREHVEGAALVVAARLRSRRATRMEMHQAIKEELNDLYNSTERDGSWEDTNVLASLHTSLAGLWDVYAELADRGRTPPGAYEVTSLTRP